VLATFGGRGDKNDPVIRVKALGYCLHSSIAQQQQANGSRFCTLFPKRHLKSHRREAQKMWGYWQDGDQTLPISDECSTYSITGP